MYWICNSACGLLPRRAATAIGYVSKFEGIYFKKDIGNKAGEITSQAQVKKDELLDQASDAAHSAQNSSPNLTGQATNFLQQTGEQVKHMAQGAAVAVKNTLGLNTDSPNSTNYRSNTNSPSNPNTASNINNPSNPNTESNIDNPSYPNTTSNINNPSNPSTRI
ncbi:hypothetical protein RGQ29_020836 [Quercus rubra]|uniref:Late embryogenesis abundant protein n=1 Tax=Quercus rubra TaxID=3512 RepID=A0AAN7FC87_QUERU|nr:hypothetical protein RGQ29_020836 [Quercus rubra]